MRIRSQTRHDRHHGAAGVEVANGRQAVHEDMAYSDDVGEDGRDVSEGKAAAAF